MAWSLGKCNSEPCGNEVCSYPQWWDSQHLQVLLNEREYFCSSKESPYSSFGLSLIFQIGIPAGQGCPPWPRCIPSPICGHIYEHHLEKRWELTRYNDELSKKYPVHLSMQWNRMNWCCSLQQWLQKSGLLKQSLHLYIPSCWQPMHICGIGRHSMSRRAWRYSLLWDVQSWR